MIMNYALGGSFNSHINMNLREHHGFTYGARSGFSGNQFVGPFSASAGVRTSATDSSVVEFMKEIKQYALNGITADELTFSKNAIGQSEALKYETSRQKADFIKRIMDYNLDRNFTLKQNEILNSITTEEVDALAKKHLPYNNMDILIVGDRSKVFDNLLKLGYEIIELDTDGNPLNTAKEKSIDPALKKNSPGETPNPGLIKPNPNYTTPR